MSESTSLLRNEDGRRSREQLRLQAAVGDEGGASFQESAVEMESKPTFICPWPSFPLLQNQGMASAQIEVEGCRIAGICQQSCFMMLREGRREVQSIEGHTIAGW